MSLILQPGRSRCLAAALFGVHVLAGLSAWLTGFPLAAKIALSLLVALIWYKNQKHFDPKTCKDCIVSAMNTSAQWTLTDATSGQWEADSAKAMLVTRWLVLLEFAGKDSRQRMLICKDALPADNFRQLQVAVRTGQL